MTKVAILGYGTVGSGVYEIIKRNNEILKRNSGDEIEVKYVLDLRDFPGDPVEEVLVHDFNVIANDPDVDIVCEVMGGFKPAYDFVKTCLMNGKSVCTSNKELVERAGAELISIAKEKNVNFFFEAAVGGGIPVIRPMIECVTADEVLEIAGILNGTTNYILTKMTNEGADFDEVLKDAQAKGYAEKDPTADIEGHDACRKIAILTSLACGKQVSFEDIKCEGITKISRKDIQYAAKLGKKIKLLGKTNYVDGTYYSMVAPFMIGNDHPLYNVDDVFNAIMVDGNMLGQIMFYGKGAGKLPTASAVVSDVVAAIKYENNVNINWDGEKMNLGDSSTFVSKYFVRVDNLVEEVKAIFPTAEFVEANIHDEVAFVTDKLSAKEFEELTSKLTVINYIRVN